MVCTITYILMIVLGSFASLMLFLEKLIPYETRILLDKKQLSKYRNNLIKISIIFTLVSVLFLIEHIYHIRSWFYYIPLILLTWYAVKKLVSNLNILNKAKNKEVK
ncbi:hypothetical protein KMP11_00165 [Gemella sp. zg-570]|uniref:hypothetical protein n=1 Tax=Gemella sp. zg-570 TaxID=2840371 RepID=UPI001C0D18DC|nr:hypothetical protein [Gemella sp. zg-570]QWQ38815.1 hypothetical protein KMP11_00165 [Gemella sp. zg-570]